MTYAQYCRLNVHVGASNRAVVKKAHTLLAKRVKRAVSYRQMRHAWLRSVLEQHAAARKLFTQVATGRFG